MSETDIQRAILDALAAIGAFAFRTNSSKGAVKVRGGWVTLCPPGTPDILIVVPPRGRLLGLEVKTAKGEERESQLAWASRARGLGAGVETVRSVAEAVEAYRSALGRPGSTS